MFNLTLSSIRNKLLVNKWLIFNLLFISTLLIPTYLRLFGTVWQDDEHAHGPIILIVSLWLFWEKREALLQTPRHLNNVVLEWIFLTFGLMLYAIARSQDIIFLEVASHIPIIAAVLSIYGGRKILREVWFPIIFMIFLVPLPGFIIDGITGPLKAGVSHAAEFFLYVIGYPIARNGVVLTIGQYQLLVADACSGLHSIYSLFALGILFMYLMGHKNIWRISLLFLLILPIAFFANVVRVIILVLITYYFGDEAGQGFVHGLAGMVLFIIGLALLFLTDYLLSLFFKDNKGAIA